MVLKGAALTIFFVNATAPFFAYKTAIFHDKLWCDYHLWNLRIEGISGADYHLRLIDAQYRHHE